MIPTSGGEIGLDEWLCLRRSFSRSGPGATLVLGGTGHLLLSPAEEAEITAHLVGRVLPDIARQAPSGGVLVATGAAPGADLVFHRTALDWFRRTGIACRGVALLPVPPEWLIQDWVLYARSAGLALEDETIARHRAALSLMLEESQWRVTLYRPRSEPAPRSLDWRTDQYRQLAACLAEQPDILVAMLRAQNLREPGGTAEVVEWRRHIRRIPPQLSTLDPQEPESLARRRPLIVIDPSVRFGHYEAQSTMPQDNRRDDERAMLDEVEQARRSGNELRCHDLLASASKRGLRSRRMDYLRILTLANLGNTALALEHYRGLVLAPDEIDEDWMALQGRLEKDLAQQASSDAEAQAHYLHSADAYASAFLRSRGAYSGVNAATMYCMAGKTERARLTALTAREALDELPAGNPVRDFYRHATVAEIALHLGDFSACSASLARADRLLVGDITRRGRTLRQLRQLCRQLRIDEAVLDALQMPTLVLLRRSAGSRLAFEAGAAPTIELGDGLKPGMPVFASLLDPLDLQLAQQLLERGLNLYPVLAQPKRELQGEWTRNWGEASAAQLLQILRRAQPMAVAPGFLDSERDWCTRQLDSTALGASLLTARRLGCPWRLVSVSLDDGIARCLAVKLGAEQQRLACLQQESGAGPGRRMVGILFADFVGFRRIADIDMPRFWREVMIALISHLKAYGERVLHAATWGDALHVITDNATTAADIAADIQRLMETRRQQRSGSLQALELRIAAHYAPAFEETDPLRQTPVFYGSQISFAARIEPVTPPGTLFGSDTFVARLAIESPDRFSAEYAGELELAKQHGAHPLFVVRRRAAP
ncbi:tetratricopeptide repeat-containing protein [Hydrocarboniphaga effusa]|jgi:hypothetical protein|uniref:tetratricopeptide repeat-containing protein n=2 Tax=Hydrocarboniphaga effusa TaxID=243629 RepID=UPI00398BEFE7